MGRPPVKLVPAYLMPLPTSAQRKSFKKRQRQGWVYTHDRGQSFFPSLAVTPDHERVARGHERSVMGNDRDGYGADGTNHLQKDESKYLPLTLEGLRQWEMHAHVDHVFDLVPFWQRGMDAAEKGEVLRLEEFLEKMEGDGGWRTANEVLGMLGGWRATPPERGRGYDEAGWGAPCRDDWAGSSQRGAWDSHWGLSQRGGWTRTASDATESSHRRRGIREKWAEDGSGSGMGRGGGDAAQDGWGVRVPPARAVRCDGGREELRHFVDAIARQEAATEERRRQMHLFFEMPLEQKIEKIEETIRILRAHGVSRVYSTQG